MSMDSRYDDVVSLVAGLKKMSARAWSEFALRYGVSIQIWCNEMLTESLVEDAAQEVFLCCMRDIAQIREPEKLSGWVRSIARHQSLMALRLERFRPVSLDGIQLSSRWEAELSAGEKYRAIAVHVVGEYGAQAWELLDQRVSFSVSLDDLAKTNDMTVRAVKQRLRSIQASINREFTFETKPDRPLSSLLWKEILGAA